ncbi:hypothetical protein Tsubulata_029415 [Turnera subulata]|uniref:SHSP domain-containing protein n=1 Tax=Turnera subulata TaxID=218843 RepID=A0A9Q0F6K4_9ROSI|nr:hypothetical protein Tsubulata_029415 [Turnera subulata]
MVIFDHHPQLTESVILTGTAKAGGVGTQLGLYDIGISEDAYLCRFALPGLRRDESTLKCRIQHDGLVHIEGVIAPGGGIVKETNEVFQWRVKQLSSPGPFTISFKLPGPVDPRLHFPNFRGDGILELVILKHKAQTAPVDGCQAG